MQQALKPIWSDELKSHLQQISTRAKTVERAPVVENVVSATFPRAEPTPLAPRERPEFAAALEAVMRAAELIRDADERAQRAEDQAIELARRALAEREESESRLSAANELAERAEQRLIVALDRAAEHQRGAEAQAITSNQRIKDLESRVLAVSDKLTRAERLIADANDRVFAAETRAAEARDDVEYLQAFITDQLGRYAGSGTLDAEEAGAAELRGSQTA